MTDFKPFANAVNRKFQHMLEADEVFQVDSDSDAIWNVYLSAFPEGSNPIFRERTEHDCSCCKSFIRSVGNCVTIKEDGSFETVWDAWSELPEAYREVAQVMARYVRQLPIRSVFRTKESSYAHESNLEDMNDHVHTWNHFWSGLITGKYHTSEPEAARGRVRTSFDVFKRGLMELKKEALETVLVLIQEGSLYRGEEHRVAVEEFLMFMNGFDGTDTYVWQHAHSPASRFRNTVIGTLVTDLSDGVDLEKAVKSFEMKVAPTNYKRTKSLVTPKMVEAAEKKLEELGLIHAIERRHARVEDIAVTDVLFVDRDVAPKMKGLSGIVTGRDLKPSKTTRTDTQEIAINDFLSDVLPSAKELSVILENRHASNFLTLTAPVEDSRNLFKWGNAFAWSYDGDATDSVRERVKAAGGSVSCDLRVSLAWYNHDDLDIHAIIPGHNEIYYGHKQGILDVDMNAGGGTTRTPVENLAFNKLRDGAHKIYVNQYCKRESTDGGFLLEVEYGGATQQFTYKNHLSRKIKCLEIVVKKRRVVQIDICNKDLIAGSDPIEKWGVRTEQAVPVDIAMFSPNFWDDNAVGHRHFMFMLRNCLNPNPVRGFYNEFLCQELTEHRKVLEIVGARSKAEPSDQQLSGVGFSSTRRDQATFLVDGRAYNVQF